MVQLLLPIIYISFISLGLPDSLLGSAWPSMYPALGVPVSYAGLISMIISFGTIVSSLNSDRFTRALGTGKVTALSVAMTAAALFGFSVSTQFWMLCLWAVPYGLGAGSVDAALNNYVALHYKSRHMSWLHCMWGIGTMISPMVMGRVLAGGTGFGEFVQRCTDADRCKYRNRRILQVSKIVWVRRIYRNRSSGRGRDERTVVYTGDYGSGQSGDKCIWAEF